MHIRRASEDDVSTLASLLGELGYPTDPAELPDRLRAVEQQGGVTLVATGEGGAVEGLVCVARHATLHSSTPVAIIMALVVAASARGQGAGRALVAAAEDWARSEGCGKLSVTSAEHRADAHAFYPRCGMP